MSRARDFANLAGAADAGTLSGDNIVINGDMAVWQRGTTIDTITSGEYLCDRWRLAHGGTDGNVDVDRSTDVPSGQGFAYSQKISMDDSETSLDAGDYVNLQTRFEGQNLQHLLKGTSSAKSFTVSFWVKSSVAETYTVNIYDNDNSRHISASYVINAADTWEKKTITFAGDTSGVLDNDNNRSLDLGFWLDAGTSWTSGTFATSWESYTQSNRVEGTTGWLESTSPEFYITGVKLEVGTTATDFQHESYGDNLAKCQRYYHRNEENTFGLGETRSSTSAVVIMHLPTSMRVAPTAMDTSGTGSEYRLAHTGTATNCNAVPTLSNCTEQVVQISCAVGSGLTSGRICRLVRASASPYLGFSAEL
jgi:hypothetical protein